MARPWTQRLESACASCTPFQEVALKDLSDSLPTSVTRPTFQVFEQLLEPPPVELPPPPQASAITPAAARTATCRKTFILSTLPKIDRGAERAGGQSSPRGNRGHVPTVVR